MRRPACRSGRALRACLRAFLLPALLVFAPAAEAQSLAELVAATPPGETLVLPAGRVTGRVDLSDSLTLVGGEGTTLAAPEDDAVLVLLPGASLALSGVTLVQEGRTAYALYVDGGDLVLQDCRIEGNFEVAIYVGSGSLSLQDCTIEGGAFAIQAAMGATVTLQGLRLSGQTDTGISVNGATLSLGDVSVTGGSGNGVVVVAAPEFRADGLSISGDFANGLWVESTEKSTLGRLAVQVAGQALILVGGGEASVDGFLLQGSAGGLHAETLATGLRLTRGRIEAGAGATTAALQGLGGLTLDDVEVTGGETGLYVTGPLTGASFSRLLLQSQTGTGLFLDATKGDAPLVIHDLRAIATGTGIAAYFRATGPVTLSQSALIAAGPTVFGSEGWSEPTFQDSALIGAPEVADHELVFDPGPDGTRVFLPEGPLSWAGDPAILPGSLAVTLADFADYLPPDSGLQAPVLAFALGQSFQPQDLALALDYALPFVAEVAAPEDLTEITLAAPEPGWLWDPAAIRITLTGSDGKPVDYLPADFPLPLAAGTYAMALDGRAAGRVTLGPDAAMLALPLPEAPFYAWRDDQGQKWRGPALYLRPKAELSALLAGFRPLRPGEYWGFAPQFAPRAGADRALAAETIAKARERLPRILAEMVELRKAEAWPAYNLRWQEADILLDVFAGFGTLDDAAWLIALDVPEGAEVPQIETAILIEMRLGALADGAAMARARALFAAGMPGDDPARHELHRLVEALGRSGLPEGTALLAQFAAALPEPPAGKAPDPTGVIELSRLSPKRSAGVPEAFLDRFASDLQAYLDGTLPADAVQPIYQDQWNAAIAALAHEALIAPPGSPARRLPIPPNAAIGSSSWAFADPLVVFGGLLGQTGPANPDALSGWTYRFQDYICSALAYRDPKVRQAMFADLRTATANAIAIWATPEENRSDPAIMADQYASADFALDLILGECILSDPVLNSFGRDAAGEEAAIFDNLDFEPLWWLRRPRTEAALAGFARGEDYPALYGHSAVPLPEVEADLASGAKADPDLQAAFLARHRLMSDAFQSSFDHLTFGAERRQFRLRSEGGNGSITIAGYLDILPVISKGRLIVAIRPQIESPDYGGLAAMITEPDRAPYEADHRRLMFETLSLDRSGQITPMGFEGTSARGVHFFAAPLEGGTLDDLTLHLAMRFVDTTWEIDVPLWAGNLAYGLRLRSPPLAEDAP